MKLNIKNIVVGSTAAITAAGGVGLQLSAGSLDKDGMCTMNGGGTRPDDIATSQLKNRYSTPHEDDFLPGSYGTGPNGGSAVDSWKTLLALPVWTKGNKTADLSADQKGFRLRGYITDVEEGGVEVCNCHQKEPEHRDVHIYISAAKSDPKYAGKPYSVIVEVTPRIRRLLHHEGDWDYKSLQSLLGKQVDIEGWLFYDGEHWPNAVKESGTSNLWRQTCWEIHPVVNIQAVNVESDLSAVYPLLGSPTSSPKKPKS